MKNKIKVTPEGRDYLYLVDREEAKKFIKDLDVEEIHNFVGGPPMMFGTDWGKESIYKLIDREDSLIAIILDPEFHFSHQFVITTTDKRYGFDVGKLTLEDLDIRCGAECFGAVNEKKLCECPVPCTDYGCVCKKCDETKVEVDQEPLEVNDSDREELARLIKEGFTSGRLDSENGKKISWELKTEIWKD